MIGYNETKCILLIGRGGNGKTSCVNTLAYLQVKVSDILAVECRGVGETGDDLLDDIETVLNNVEGQVEKCQRYGGIDAFGFVLKYGVRFTQQEKNAVEVAKLTFGDDVFKNWGVLIFTYGDLFDGDNNEGGLTFLEWCGQQSGDIRTLFEEVNYRCVLFDNKTKEKNKMKEQVQQLQKNVHEVASKRKYQMLDFNNARKGREVLVYREKKRPLPDDNIVKDEKINTFLSITTLYLVLTGIICLITGILHSILEKVLSVFKKLLKIPERCQLKIQRLLHCILRLICKMINWTLFVLRQCLHCVKYVIRKTLIFAQSHNQAEKMLKIRP